MHVSATQVAAQFSTCRPQEVCLKVLEAYGACPYFKCSSIEGKTPDNLAKNPSIASQASLGIV